MAKALHGGTLEYRGYLEPRERRTRSERPGQKEPRPLIAELQAAVQRVVPGVEAQGVQVIAHADPQRFTETPLDRQSGEARIARVFVEIDCEQADLGADGPLAAQRHGAVDADGRERRLHLEAL